MAETDIERELTVLLRRGSRIHLSTLHGDVSLERSAYAIMCHLADEGPHRLGVLAAAFGLDASTISRQVQDLEKAGLACRKRDPSDRRAWVLELTVDGREILERTRHHRRAMLRHTLSDWPKRDLVVFGRLLQEFNNSMERLGAFGVLLATHGFLI
jgi:DNA-binding MarR family transcriptional regulator